MNTGVPVSPTKERTSTPPMHNRPSGCTSELSGRRYLGTAETGWTAAPVPVRPGSSPAAEDAGSGSKSVRSSVGGTRAADEQPHPLEQLQRLKRLGDVLVGDLQPHLDIGGLGLGRQQDDRDRGRLRVRSQAAGYFY